MNIGISIQLTLREIKTIFLKIMEVLQMNIPIWLILLILSLAYIIYWRQRIFNWKVKLGMLNLWKFVRDLRMTDFRDKGRTEIEISDLMKCCEWEEIFRWERPKSKPKFLPNIIRSKKNATT